MKNNNIFDSLKRLFSTSVIVRNVGGKQLKVVDTDSLQSNSMAYLRDKYTRLYSTSYLGHHNESNMMAYQAVRLELFRDYDCITGDTIIPTPNGRKLTIKELTDGIKDKQQRFQVFSYDLSCNLIKIGNAFNPRVVGEKEVFELTFDNGKILKTTDDHLILTSNSEYVETKNLKVNQEIVSLNGNTKIISIKPCGIEEVYDLSVDTYHNFATEACFVHNCMDRDSLIATALDIYADEITVENEFNEVLTITSSNDQIKGILYNLFYDILNIEFNLWSWARNMCKYGDFYLVMDISPEYGVNNVRPVSTYDMRRVENSDPANPNYVFFEQESMGKDGRLENYQVAHFRFLSDSNWLPYGRSLVEPARRTWKQLCLKHNTNVWTSNGYKEIKDIKIGDEVYSYDYNNGKIVPTFVKNCLQTGIKKTYNLKTSTKNICLTEDHPVLVKNINDVYEYKQVKDLKNDTIISPMTDDIYENITSIEVDEEACEVWDLEVESDLHNFIANGIVVHNCLLEDAMLIHRIVRAPEKRVFKIDIANIPPAEVDVYMNKLITKMKQTPFIDPKTGDYNLRYNMQNLTQDFYLPVRGNDSGNTIDNLTGMQWDSIEDIQYLQNRLLAALKVPKAFLNFDEGVSGKAVLAAEDLRFAKTVKRIQKIIISELNKIAMAHLFVQGYRDDELVDFKLELANPSTIFEQEKISLWSDKVSLAKDMIDNKIMSRKWIYQNVFNMSGNEIEEEYNSIIEDVKETFRQKKIEDEGIDPKAEHDLIKMDDGGEGDSSGGGEPSSDNMGGDEGDSGEADIPKLEESNKEFKDMNDREKEEFFIEKGKEGGRPKKLNSKTGRSDKSVFGRDPLGKKARRDLTPSNSDKKPSLSMESVEYLDELDKFLKDFDKKLIKEVL